VLIKLVEVYENKGGSATTTLTGEKNEYSLREVYVNPDHVVCLRTDELMQQNHVAGLLPEKMHEELSFTKVHINRGHSGINITVVGHPALVEESLGRQKGLLQG